MHALTITFEDADTIKTRCKAIIDGKETEDHNTNLKRVKTQAGRACVGRHQGVVKAFATGAVRSNAVK